jgi:glutathione S-transferase
MKLYYSRGTCSLAPHLVLHELELPFTTEAVNHRDKTTADGGDYLSINPKGYVPTLQLDSGEYLTEVAVILQYLADQKPSAGMVPQAGSMTRYRLLEWLHFIATEVHKNFSPLFNPSVPEDYKVIARAKLGERFAFVDRALEGADYLSGAQFAIADAYLFVVTRWSSVVGLDLGPFTQLAAFQQRVLLRPAVQRAMTAEGLLQ